MNKSVFKKKLFELKEQRIKRVSDLLYLLRLKEDNINNYDTLIDDNEKLLIEILISYSIIWIVSNLQWFLEDIVFLFEDFIIKSNKEIKTLNKDIYNMIYSIHKEEIIRDGLIYWNKISTKIWSFIKKTQTNNIIFDSEFTNSNTVSIQNIRKILKICLIKSDELLENINIDITDYNRISDKRVWIKYTISTDKKIWFFERLLKDISQARHKLSHWRDPEIKENIKEYFLLISLCEKYWINNFFLEIDSKIRNILDEKQYLI